MSKRSNGFERRVVFDVTPAKAVLPLIPFLRDARTNGRHHRAYGGCASTQLCFEEEPAMNALDVASDDNQILDAVDAAEEVRDPLEAFDPPEIPFGGAFYWVMSDCVAADWRDRNSFQHLRDYGRSRSTVEAFETQTVFIGKPATDRARAASQRGSAPALSLAWSADYGQA